MVKLRLVKTISNDAPYSFRKTWVDSTKGITRGCSTSTKQDIVYPTKGSANALSWWGPLEDHSNLYCIGERKLGFQKHQRKSTFFELPKTFVVRMGGWVDGDKKCPSIFLKF